MSASAADGYQCTLGLRMEPGSVAGGSGSALRQNPLPSLLHEVSSSEQLTSCVMFMSHYYVCRYDRASYIYNCIIIHFYHRNLKVIDNDQLQIEMSLEIEPRTKSV